MQDELAGLSRAAGKEGAEDGDVEATFHGGEDHLHVRGWSVHVAPIPGRIFVLGPWPQAPAGPAAGGLLAAVVLGHVRRVHVDGRDQAAAEHALPLVLLDVLAVVAAGHGLGDPFLLEEGLVLEQGCSQAPEVEQVVLVPCLADTLGGEEHTSVNRGPWERRLMNSRGASGRGTSIAGVASWWQCVVVFIATLARREDAIGVDPVRPCCCWRLACPALRCPRPPDYAPRIRAPRW